MNTLQKIKSFCSKNTYLILCFVFPAVILFAAFSAFGVFPVNKMSVLVLDGSAQYVYYFEAFRDAVLGNGQSLLYSWSRTLGGEMLGILTYYLLSPFSFIVLIFPKEYITEAIYLITLLKVGACGLAFGIYLKNSNNRAKGEELLVFSILYALMSYVVVQMTNIMWLDAIILLPLIILAVEKMVDEGKYIGFIIALSACFITNYYMSYMVGIFTFIYFIYYFFANNERRSALFGKRLLTFFGSTLIALMIGAVVIICAVYSLRLGKLDMNNPSLMPHSQFSFFDLFSKLLPASYDTIRPEGLPFIYSGILSSMLLPLYFLNTEFPVRKRIASAAILAFLILSMNISTIDIAWHGFQLPNWIPFRYSFAFSFVVLILSYKALRGLGNIRQKTVVLTSVAICAAVFIVQKQEYEYIISEYSVWPALVLIAVYAAILALWSKKGKTETLALLMIGIVSIETGFNASMTFSAIHRDLSYSSRSNYREAIDNVQPVVNAIKAQDDGFYRIEKTFARRVNDPLGLNFAGFSHSSSAPNAKVLSLLKYLGYCANVHKTDYRKAMPVVDSIFGIKYVMSKDSYDMPFEALFTQNDITVYRNNTALPIAYAVSDSINNFAVTTKNSSNPFLLQNSLLKAMLGEKSTGDIYTRIPSPQPVLNNVVSSSINGTYTTYTKTSPNVASSVDYTVKIPAGKKAYFYLSSNNPISSSVLINGMYPEVYFDTQPFIRQIPVEDEEREVTVRVTLKEDTTCIGDVYFYYLNDAEFENAMAALSSGGLDVSKYSQTMVSGSVYAPSDCVLFTSIPFESGWNAYVDGEKVDPQIVCDAFIGIPLGAGEHSVTFSFLPKELLIGALISPLGLLLLLLLIIRSAKTGKKPPITVKGTPLDDTPDDILFENAENTADTFENGADSASPPY